MKICYNGNALAVFYRQVEAERLQNGNLLVSFTRISGGKYTAEVVDGGKVQSLTDLVAIASSNRLSGGFLYPTIEEKLYEGMSALQDNDEWDVRALKGQRYNPFTGEPA